MEEGVSCPQFRLYLEAAKFHYRQMIVNIQDRNAFIFYLLAFLPLARSVTLVFQEEFSGSNRLMSWYQTKVEAWKSNKIVNLFKEMRNICVHEHAPIMLVSELVPLSVLLPSSTEYKTKEVSPSNVEIVSYLFELPEQIEENPEVTNLCLKYLDELEEFVIEAENMMRTERLSHGEEKKQLSD